LLGLRERTDWKEREREERPSSAYVDLFFDLFFVLILFRPTLKPPTHANTPHRSSTPSTP